MLPGGGGRGGGGAGLQGNSTPLDKYELREQIGKGAFGAAFLVIHRETRAPFVLKKIRLARQTEWQRKASYREMQLVASLTHPYIVPFRESWIERGHTICIINGFCEAGDLSTMLRSMQALPHRRYFPENQLKVWLVQMLFGLEYLHRHEVIHRDLKSSNIFLTANGDIQIGDFGLSTMSGDGQELVGTPHYMCPELVSKSGYGVKADVWSLGVIMHELSAQKTPFSAFNFGGLIQKILKARPGPLPSEYSKEWVRLIRSMMRKEPEKRPHVQDLLRHPALAHEIGPCKARMQQLMPGMVENPSLAKQLSLTWRPDEEVDAAAAAGEPTTEAANLRNIFKEEDKPAAAPAKDAGEASLSNDSEKENRATERAGAVSPSKRVQSTLPATREEAQQQQQQQQQQPDRRKRAEPAAAAPAPAQPLSPSKTAGQGSPAANAAEGRPAAKGTKVASPTVRVSSKAAKTPPPIRSESPAVPGKKELFPNGTAPSPPTRVSVDRGVGGGPAVASTSMAATQTPEKGAPAGGAPAGGASEMERLQRQNRELLQRVQELERSVKLCQMLSQQGKLKEVEYELGKMAAKSTPQPSQFNIGDTVLVGRTQKQVGLIRYFGPTAFGDGDWVGIELQNPVGRTDGTVNGISYFKCGPKRGIFVQASLLKGFTQGGGGTAA